MSIFGNLGGLLGDLVERHGGAEAMVENALQQAGGVEGLVDRLSPNGTSGPRSTGSGQGPASPPDPAP